MLRSENDSPKARPSARYRKHLAAQAKDERPTLRGWPATPTVYFVQARALRLIKIGVTMDLGDRLKTLRVGCPDQLELLGAIYDRGGHVTELTLHGRFDEHRSHGEWFHPCPELLEFIAENSLEAYDRARDAELRSALHKAYG